jgi:hypothetical protein
MMLHEPSSQTTGGARGFKVITEIIIIDIAIQVNDQARFRGARGSKVVIEISVIGVMIDTIF